MALQAGMTSSKVLVLVGAGLTGSIILRSGRLSDLIVQLQEILTSVNDAEISPKYDSDIIAAQIRQLAQEIRELTLSRPVTIFNGNSTSGGSYASYIMPAAAIGAIGYCYMWLKGWSFSDVMFVTKHSMANAVATVSKQLEDVYEAVASTKRHLTTRIENLDGKLDEEKETSHQISMDVKKVKSNLSQIEDDVEIIRQIMSEMGGRLETFESKQDMTNLGLLRLCEAAEGINGGVDIKPVQDVSAKLAKHSAIKFEEKSCKGLQFISESEELSIVKKSTISTNKDGLHNLPGEKVSTVKTSIHRSYPVGISFTRDLLGSVL
ncbi:hypothetical protein PanWU01x14_236850 [Parasponia andersonii]|uniref:DUF1664 domain-containing protein n=1 Tax=Parasponia andersonii TaxID=3476 RepID=A0A2P5BI64_PARAD|nr:hypothetical protein PanWU01x14_236850 [Parasponia andersonii]